MHRYQRLRGLSVLCLYSLAACDAPLAPLPPGAQAFNPPAIYRRWWQLTEACSGLSGDLSAIRWYVVPGATSVPMGDGRQVDGFWEPGTNRIVLAGDDQMSGALVRHEMLHALSAEGDHPRTQFVQRCGGVVVCDRRCIADGGPAPAGDPVAIHVSPETLDVEVNMIPSDPAASRDDGYFMMVVSARNPTATSLQIDLPPSGDAGPPVTFEYRIRSTGTSWYQTYNVRFAVPEVVRFSPGETKQFVFDLRAGSDAWYVIAPGTYTCEGAFGDNWVTSPPTVVIAP